MNPIQVNKKYESKIYYRGKLIYKIDCLCPDFQFRRKKMIGECSDRKVYAEPCKYLKYAVKVLESLGFTLKKPKEMIGSNKLTKGLWKQLLERAKQCEDCGSDYLLQAHRKTRGSNGGKYNQDNCIVLCAECHKARHAGEFK